MINWHFMRHGQIASNLKQVYSGRSGEDLTEEGRAQVRRECRSLAPLGIDAIYCSPLTRARQTAEIVVDELKWDMSINLDESFNELKMGPWEGMREADVEARFPEHWATWNNTPAELRLDGRETLAELQRRVLDGMRAIERDVPASSILVVTHVAVIRVISLFAENRDLNGYKSVPVGNAKVYSFPALGI